MVAYCRNRDFIRVTILDYDIYEYIFVVFFIDMHLIILICVNTIYRFEYMKYMNLPLV